MRPPKPLVPANVDLRDFAWMPLDVMRLANSETWAKANGWEAKAAVNLWCRAWHQVPAGSLPNDDAILALWAGVPDFQAVKEVAMRRFILCRDGRFYHRTICEKALESWERKSAASDSRETDRQRKKGQRTRKAQLKQQTSHADIHGTSAGLPRDIPGTSDGHPTEFRSMRRTRRKTGTKEERNLSVSKESSNGKGPSTRQHGTRLQADWVLTEEWRKAATVARAKHDMPEIDLDLEADIFRDHWIGKAGKEGVKIDWLATWRKWCLSHLAGAGRQAAPDLDFTRM